MEISQHSRRDNGQRIPMLWEQSQLGFMTKENETKKVDPMTRFLGFWLQFKKRYFITDHFY